MAKKNIQKDSNLKLDMANKIASKAPRFQSSYTNVENTIMYGLRSIAGLLDKIFQSKKLSSVFALTLAIVLYVVVNSTGTTSIDVTQSATLNNIPVQIVYNSEIYEISGIPSKVNVIVQGDMSDITLQKSQNNSVVVADLSGLTEGTYNLKMIPSNFNSKLSVNVLDTPTVTVVIKKKVTSKFNISYEYINKNSMESVYTLSTPVFDSTEVLIRASQETIDSIAFVKALIDVTGANATFSTSAPIVAYDNDGHIVDCDIIPETVNATVEVTSPSKTVPIKVRPVGQLAEGLSIDSINLDYSSVTLYSSQQILNLIDAIYVDVDISSINKDTIFSTTLTMPSGVNKMSVTRVNMEIALDETVTKEVSDVKVSWINYSSGFKFMIVNPQEALMNVTVAGTANNINKINADNISVAIDLANVSVGTQQAPLIVNGDNPYVTYQLPNGKKYIEVLITE